MTRQSGGPRDVPGGVSTHPRNLGRAWLRPTHTAPRDVQVRDDAPAAAPRVHVKPTTAQLDLVPTSEELVRLGVLPRVHRLTRDEMSMWNASDESDRDEARRAIREAVREEGGGDLLDHRGRLLERIG